MIEQHLVSDDDIARFKEDGAICVRNVLDRKWCERMNGAVERLLLNPGKRAREATKAGDPGRFHMNVFMWRWDPDFRDCALNSPLPELAATLMGQDKVSLFYDQAFIKEPGTREVTQWHQDLPYWPALGGDIVSLWVALTPVTSPAVASNTWLGPTDGENSIRRSPPIRTPSSPMRTSNHAPISPSSRVTENIASCRGTAMPVT